MGILEDQRHQLDVDSLYSTDPEIRAGAIRRLAALPGGVLQQSARRAEREALAERTKWIWSKQNPSFAIEANFQVMEKFLAEAGIQISDDAFDLAFQACRNQLAERVLEVPEPTAEEVRIAENSRLLGLSKNELRREINHATRKLPMEVTLPYTRQQLVDMPGPEMRRLIYREDGSVKADGAYSRAVTRILNGSN